MIGARYHHDGRPVWRTGFGKDPKRFYLLQLLLLLLVFDGMRFERHTNGNQVGALYVLLYQYCASMSGIGQDFGL